MTLYDVCARLQPYLTKNISSQPNFSRIFLLIAIIRLSRISAEFFPTIRNFKKIWLGSLIPVSLRARRELWWLWVPLPDLFNVLHCWSDANVPCVCGIV